MAKVLSWALVTVLLGPTVVPPRLAAGAAGPAADADFRYFSKFGDRVLGQSQLIVRGRVAAVKPVPRAELATIEVATTFKGAETRDVVILANPGEFFVGSELLLFLREFEGGPRTTCFNRISVTDPDYEVKERFLRQQLRLEDLADEEIRRDYARSMLLESARSTERWVCWNTLRELAYVLDRYPELIREGEAVTLAGIADASEDPEFARELRALLRSRE
jgi:hypothetical protein